MQSLKNFFSNISNGITSFLGKHKYKIILMFLITILSLYFMRAWIYIDVINLRKHSPEIVTIFISFFMIILSIYGIIKLKGAFKTMVSLISFSLFSLIIFGTYFSFFIKNKEHNPYMVMNYSYAISKANTVEMNNLPLTNKERIYPYQSIEFISKDKLSSSDYTTEHFEIVYDSKTGELNWNSEKTPVGKINKISQNVQGVVSINSSSDLIQLKEHIAEFNYGRKLTWFNSLGYILPKYMKLYNYFDKEIDDNVRLVQKENGKWVQVVSVVNWEGVFPFTYPTFDGVFLIEEKSDKFNNVTFLNTDFFVPIENPEIEYVKSENIKNYKFLNKQNLIPEEMTRFYAKSWTFKNGIYNFFVDKKDLTKITKIPEESNQQPFTIWFEEVADVVEGNIYQFFALEPRGVNKALSEILLFDSSNSNRLPTIYHYNFNKHNKKLIGPERIAKTVKDSDTHADWNTFMIAESRPFIIDTENGREFLFINSIIARSNPSSKPRISIANPDTLNVEWIEGSKIKDKIEKMKNKSIKADIKKDIKDNSIKSDIKKEKEKKLEKAQAKERKRKERKAELLKELNKIQEEENKIQEIKQIKEKKSLENNKTIEKVIVKKKIQTSKENKDVNLTKKGSVK